MLTHIYIVNDARPGHKPVLERYEVTKESAQFITIASRPLAFGCRARIPKHEVHLSPRGAWEAFIEEQTRRRMRAKQELEEAERMLAFATEGLVSSF